jgi:hypothetical protein
VRLEAGRDRDGIFGSARDCEPPWLASATNLGWREARIQPERRNHARVRQPIEDRPARQKFAAVRALEFVADYRARGDDRDARALVKIIVTHAPESRSAQKQLAELGADAHVAGESHGG